MHVERAPERHRPTRAGDVLRWDVDRLAREDASAYIAHVGGRDVGFVTTWVHRKDAPFLIASQVLVVDQLGVVAAARGAASRGGHGAGGGARRRDAGCDAVELSVAASNAG